jgi:hypothetical protein
MMNFVIGTFGKMIGCFCSKGIGEFLSLPPTRSIPSLSMKGFKLWSFPPTSLVRSFWSCLISLEKYVSCIMCITLLWDELVSSTVSGVARFCLFFQQRHRATTLMSFGQEEYRSKMEGSIVLLIKQMVLFCSGISSAVVGLQFGQFYSV